MIKNEEEYKIRDFGHINNNLFKSFMLIADISEKLKFLNLIFNRSNGR